MPYTFLLLLIFSLGQCSSIEPPIEDIDNDIDEEIELPTEPELPDTTVLHIEIARSNQGKPSTDSINVWLEFVGLGPGLPWCAAAQSAWLHQADVISPRIKTGLASNFINQTDPRTHISAGRVLAGVETVPKGSLVVLQRGNTIYGHIGASTIDWKGPNGVYISGNTSAPGGAEATGGEVWEKPIRINPNAYMRITTFVIVEYE